MEEDFRRAGKRKQLSTAWGADASECGVSGTTTAGACGQKPPLTNAAVPRDRFARSPRRIKPASNMRCRQVDELLVKGSLSGEGVMPKVIESVCRMRRKALDPSRPTQR